MSDVKISVGVQGAAEAQQAIKGVGHAATGMGKELGETIHVAHRMETGLNAIEKAMGENVSAAHAFGGGLRVISQAMKALLMDGPQLLLTVAIMALGAAINAIVGHFEEMKKKTEEAKKASEEHAKVLEELKAFKFTTLIKQYDEVKRAADAAADASERLQSAQMKLLSAQEKHKIAGIEANASVQLAGLDASSPLYEESKKAIQEQKARDVSEVQVAYANKQADMELVLEKQKQAKAVADITMADQKRAAEQQHLDEVMGVRKNVVKALADIEKITLENEKLSENGGPAYNSNGPAQYKERQGKLDFNKLELARLKGYVGDHPLVNAEKDVQESKSAVFSANLSQQQAYDTAKLAGLNVTAAETTREATNLNGITKGMDFVGQNNEIIAKDYPFMQQASASGDQGMATFIQQFNEFMAKNTTMWQTLNTQLSKHSEVLKNLPTPQ